MPWPVTHVKPALGPSLKPLEQQTLNFFKDRTIAKTKAVKEELNTAFIQSLPHVVVVPGRTKLAPREEVSIEEQLQHLDRLTDKDGWKDFMGKLIEGKRSPKDNFDCHFQDLFRASKYPCFICLRFIKP
jgi:hypothetical protein